MKTKIFMQLLKKSAMLTMVCIMPFSHVYPSNEKEIGVEDEEWGENCAFKKFLKTRKMNAIRNEYENR